MKWSNHMSLRRLPKWPPSHDRMVQEIAKRRPPVLEKPGQKPYIYIGSGTRHKEKPRSNSTHIALLANSSIRSSQEANLPIGHSIATGARTTRLSDEDTVGDVSQLRQQDSMNSIHNSDLPRVLESDMVRDINRAQVSKIQEHGTWQSRLCT